LAFAVRGDIFRRADNFVYDRFLRLGTQPPSDDIIIVAIDDESVHRLGRFPWPRQVHGQMLARLAAAKPRAILYDVLFVDPSPGDDRLAAGAAISHPIVPLYMEIPGKNGAAVTVIPPVPELRAAGVEIGHANLSPDEDGVVRRVYLAEGMAPALWHHVAALAACRAGHRACDLKVKDGAGGGYLRADPFLIPFGGSRQHFRTVPSAAVLAGSVPDVFFHDKIVLVGATATGLSDTYATPMSARGALMPGVEVNANIVQALMIGRGIAAAPIPARLAFALLPLWLLLAGFRFASPRFNLVLGGGLGALVLLISAGALNLGGVWVSPIAALVGLIVVYPLWGWRRLHATSVYMHEELERFRGDPDILLTGRSPGGDQVQSDIDLLQAAISRARDLQHFVTDTLKGLPDASLVLGIDGHVRMSNDRSRLLLGEVEGAHFADILADFGRSEIKRGAPPGPDSTPAEITDELGRVFDVRWSPVHTRSGELAAWVLRLADLTELRTATRQREEALQLLTHDMRSPQASIIAALSQAEDQIAPPLSKRIESYARRTLALADGFVQLARAEAQPLAPEELNLADMVLDAVDDQWPLSSQKQIRIETEGCDDELLVRGDRALLTRAIINLVGNAIKYSPENSIVRCRLAREDGEAVVTVRDLGSGLTDDQIAALFQPFRQVGGGTVDGVGLGLAFVRSVASRHGGSVACRSEPGEGSCFEVRLPAIADQQGSATGG
jgi:CHASE2 domain-containing sensor protein/signal transduction histidine kinase